MASAVSSASFSGCRRPRGDEIEQVGGTRSRHLPSSYASRRTASLYRRKRRSGQNAYCRSIEPDITDLHLPPMKVRVTTPSAFSATARSKLGRPRSTPCPMAASSRSEDFAPQMGKEPDKRHVRASGRGIFEHAMQRRKHSRLKVSALFCVLDVEMNSRRLISRQMPEEDIHALLRPAQRGPIPHLSDDEWRAASGQTWRMPARLNIRWVKRAGLRDHCGVEIANDPKLLGRGQSRSGGETTIRVDCHSDESGYFLEDHVPAIEAPAADLVLARQNKRRADVWMASKRHLCARRKNAHPSSVRRIIRRQDKRCLGEIKLIGDRLHLSVRKAARIGNHRQRVAAELPIGEDIDRLELHSHRRYVLGQVVDHCVERLRQSFRPPARRRTILFAK